MPKNLKRKNEVPLERVKFLSTQPFSDGKKEALGKGIIAFSENSTTCMIVDLDECAANKAKEVIRKAGTYPLGLLVLGRQIPLPLIKSLLQKEFSDFLTTPSSREKAILSLRNILQGLKLRKKALLASQKLRDSQAELKELTDIGIALSSEKDLNILLGMIVEKGRLLTGADAGSLYIVEGEALEGRPRKRLRFKIAQNDSIAAPYTEFTLEINKSSIAGYIASTGKILNIADAYKIPPDSEFTWNKSFDEKFGYRTKSMLVVPMRNHLGDIIGVLQLINRKREPEIKLTSPDIAEKEVVAFDKKSEEIVMSLANQAAVALENALLYEEIQRLFESFVRASVSAIESRDPTTSGHSDRVAKLTVGLAIAVDRADSGPYREVRFTKDELKELEYAGLLHDFGKIGVREQVLVKAKKLHEPDYALVLSRFEFIKKSVEANHLRKKLQLVLERGIDLAKQEFPGLEELFKKNIEELERYLKIISTCNVPTMLQNGDFNALREISERTYLDMEGRIRPFLTEEEVFNLSLPKGSLNEKERLEIESHVAHTFEYLQKIPWAKKLRNIPEIAFAHHEKLNGRGYPRRIPSEEIPLQSKMMAISDIYDALTASDRPYKKAVPPYRALEILDMEVKAGQIDNELFRLFVDGRVYESVAKKA